ncbi:Alanine dehydrogenase/pyridine nucleotide transhydrogenase N-terminal [Penicillium frequentans]|uniref:Alanine dehydrogenase/pyridine nucleotide transhydrogenase N-terminal n=1 Tax=Penicillium frequentans TaxID=3151616 RepID=A0AAD6D0A0_9EURO|nr:Alanine dehydrogenase/pyridine nucleotide transhydrogenase N-terminal [Penicillium glabrum]
MFGQKIWLRAKTKPAEARSACESLACKKGTYQLEGKNWRLTKDPGTVTPTTYKALIDAGYQVTIERSPQSIFDDFFFFKL